MKPQSGIRITTLVLVGVVTASLGWLLLRTVEARGSVLADPGWIGFAVMVCLGVLVLVSAWQVKQVRDHTAQRHLSPLRAARTLVLGQAAALTGAVLVGWYVANVLVLLPDADVDSQRDRLWPFALHTIVAAGLAVAGLVGQHWCRLRPTDDDANGSHGSLG